MMTGGGLYGGFGFENKGFRFKRPPSEGSGWGVSLNCDGGYIITLGMVLYGRTFDFSEGYLTEICFKDTQQVTLREKMVRTWDLGSQRRNIRESVNVKGYMVDARLNTSMGIRRGSKEVT